jgi:hypothetical protein
MRRRGVPDPARQGLWTFSVGSCQPSAKAGARLGFSEPCAGAASDRGSVSLAYARLGARRPRTVACGRSGLSAQSLVLVWSHAGNECATLDLGGHAPNLVIRGSDRWTRECRGRVAAPGSLGRRFGP